METRTEVRAAVSVLLALQLLTSVGAIRMLSRMAPAIEQILADNVASISASEDMLRSLAEGDCAPLEERTARFHDGLGRARHNITEPAEHEVIASLGRDGPSALQGECAARLGAVEAASDLASINRDSMQRADVAARRLGTAGAWTAVLLGLGTFLASVGVTRRLQRRLVRPLARLSSVVAGARLGEGRRASVEGATVEVLAVAEGLNELLDRGLEQATAPPCPTAPEDRAFLNTLLDAAPGAVIAVARGGEIRAANAAALDLLAGEGGALLREALAARAATGQAGDRISRLEAAGEQGWIAWLEPTQGEVVADE